MHGLTQVEDHFCDKTFRGCFERRCLFLISLHTCVLEACYSLAGGKQGAEQWVQAHCGGRGNTSQAVLAVQAVQFCSFSSYPC